MKKIFLAFLLLLSLNVFYPKAAKAQQCGTITCAELSGSCIVGSHNCTQGGSYTDSICENRMISPTNTCDDDVGYGPYVHACICSYGSTPLYFPALYGAVGSNFHFGPGATIGGIVASLVSYFFPIAGLLLLLYLIYGGYMFLTSAGDPQKAQTAKGVITMALIGFLIIFAAYWIVQAIGQILGLPDISTVFP